MADLLPEDRQIWLRAFYGFNPEEDGYLGFTYETQREDMLGKMQDGDLVPIYGAINSQTQTDLKSQALGFLEVRLRKCADIDRQSRASKQRKIDQGYENSWTFGIEVARAWRVTNRVHIRTIAPEAYVKKNRFERSSRAMLLEQHEKRRALSHPVRQVNVFGEPPVLTEELATGSMSDVLKPTKGIPPSFGDRTSTREDGENHLYLMKLSANAELLLGGTGSHVGKALVKIGRSNDPVRRLKEINSGFPEPAICRWELTHSQPFVDGRTAHDHETELKERFAKKFSSQSGEFYVGEWTAVEQAFQTFCFSKLPKILAAAGKAEGVK